MEQKPYTLADQDAYARIERAAEQAAEQFTKDLPDFMRGDMKWAFLKGWHMALTSQPKKD